MLRSSARGNHGVHRSEATHQRCKVIVLFNVSLQKPLHLIALPIKWHFPHFQSPNTNAMNEEQRLGKFHLSELKLLQSLVIALLEVADDTVCYHFLLVCQPSCCMNVWCQPQHRSRSSFESKIFFSCFNIFFANNYSSFFDDIYGWPWWLVKTK